MENKLLISLLVVGLLIGSLGATQASAQESVELGEGDWPGIRAKNAVVAYVLETVGYEVEINMASDTVVHQSLADGNLDVYLGSWMPSIQDLREELEGELDLVATNMDEGLFTMAVPEYVWEAGVRSFADLDDYADRFDEQLFVGPTGWQSEAIMNQAVDENIYDLGSWDTVNSTQGALMAQMERAIEREEWIVFAAWKPHWMNYILEIKYLEDPEGLWPSPESWVDTLARQGFESDNPELYQFFEQFSVPVEANDEWIYKIGQEEIDSEVVAENWVEDNLDIVVGWLDGVETPAGESAAEVLRAEIE